MRSDYDTRWTRIFTFLKYYTSYLIRFFVVTSYYNNIIITTFRFELKCSLFRLGLRSKVNFYFVHTYTDSSRMGTSFRYNITSAKYSTRLFPTLYIKYSNPKRTSAVCDQIVDCLNVFDKPSLVVYNVFRYLINCTRHCFVFFFLRARLIIIYQHYV
jgi:hypothetical protein